MGKITVPRPFTTRVPRKPYTMIASCGPALRNSLANIAIKNKIARIIRAAITNTWFCINADLPPQLTFHFGVAREFLPRADVGNAFFVARDDHFGALGDRGAR